MAERRGVGMALGDWSLAQAAERVHDVGGADRAPFAVLAACVVRRLHQVKSEAV